MITDSVEEYKEEAKGLVEAMLEANALELLVQRLLSLDEKAGGQITLVGGLSLGVGRSDCARGTTGQTRSSFPPISLPPLLQARRNHIV